VRDESAEVSTLPATKLSSLFRARSGPAGGNGRRAVSRPLRRLRKTEDEIGRSMGCAQRYPSHEGRAGERRGMTDLLGILGYVSVLLIFAWVVCAVIDAVRRRR
jgi:hypothetical protein